MFGHRLCEITFNVIPVAVHATSDCLSGESNIKCGTFFVRPRYSLSALELVDGVSRCAATVVTNGVGQSRHGTRE